MSDAILHAMPNMKTLLFLVPLAAACNTVPTNTSSNPTANFFAVEDGMVYRGSRPTQQGVSELAAMKVKTILNLENNNDAIKKEIAWASSMGINEVVAEMQGTSAPGDEEVQLALDTLSDPRNMPVYVHCAKGEDRTGMVIALHRIFNQGWEAKDAEAEMEAHGYDNALVAMKDYFEQKAGLD